MVKQYEIYWITLDLTSGSEIEKTRPCLIISPDVSNKHLNTVLVAPLTSTLRNFPMRMEITAGGKTGQIALDQIHCINKKRISKKLGVLKTIEQEKLKKLLKEYLID